MWTKQNRGHYDRSQLRYPSDLTDDEWRLIEPLISPGKRGGSKRTVVMREVVNGLLYVLSAVNGARSRKTCRRKVRSTSISIYGPTTAPCRAFTRRFTMANEKVFDSKHSAENSPRTCRAMA